MNKTVVTLRPIMSVTMMMLRIVIDHDEAFTVGYRASGRVQGQRSGKGPAVGYRASGRVQGQRSGTGPAVGYNAMVV